MATCKSVITLALSKLGIAGASRAARQEDLELGLLTLQSLYRNFIDSGTLGRPRTVIVSQDYTARENDRILRTADANGDISFPLTVPVCAASTYNDCLGGPDYGLNASAGKQRPPRNGAFVVVNNALTGDTLEVIYDGYRDTWVTISDLNLDDGEQVFDHAGNLLEVRYSEAPLSSNQNGLAALLATQLADHFGAALQPTTMRDATRYEQALIQGFGEAETVRATGNYF